MHTEHSAVNQSLHTTMSIQGLCELMLYQLGDAAVTITCLWWA